MTSPSAHSIVRDILRRIHSLVEPAVTPKQVVKDLSCYLLSFFTILTSHMTQEYEVCIRGGKVTEEGRLNLKKLASEFVQFQYRDRLSEILTPWVNLLSGQAPAQHSAIQIISNVVTLVESKITECQQKILSARRAANNRMCSTKIKNGPIVHNFTDFVIPDTLKDMLGPGLQIVPAYNRPLDEIKRTILGDVKKAAVTYFQNTMGYKPKGVDRVKTLDGTLQFLTMRTPCGSPISEFYYKLRDTYVTRLPEFLSRIASEDVGYDPLAVVQELLPREIVITPTDKNLGVALVPISWYKLQYDSQCRKGNYEQVEMDEGECIRFLNAKVQDLWDSCTAAQTKLLREKWPRHRGEIRQRIGVMKIVPKVHKLDKIERDSWKILTSRPIRGAECCPLNPASKVLGQSYTIT